jgi:hypothetical protein
MEDKEIISGYIIQTYIWIGHDRVCFGIAEDHRREYPYMMCVYESEGRMFPMCETLHCFDNYPEALCAYANKISECAKMLEERRASIVGVQDPSCLKEKDVEVVSWDQSIRGRVVAVKESSLMHGYRDISHQLYFVYSGFGVEANSRGRACYGWNLYTGEKCRIERPDVMGIVPEDKLPEFAKKTLETVKEKAQKEKNYEVR